MNPQKNGPGSSGNAGPSSKRVGGRGSTYLSHAPASQSLPQFSPSLSPSPSKKRKHSDENEPLFLPHDSDDASESPPGKQKKALTHNRRVINSTLSGGLNLPNLKGKGRAQPNPTTDESSSEPILLSGDSLRIFFIELPSADFFPQQIYATNPQMPGTTVVFKSDRVVSSSSVNAIKQGSYVIHLRSTSGFSTGTASKETTVEAETKEPQKSTRDSSTKTSGRSKRETSNTAAEGTTARYSSAGQANTPDTMSPEGSNSATEWGGQPRENRLSRSISSRLSTSGPQASVSKADPTPPRCCITIEWNVAMVKFILETIVPPGNVHCRCFPRCSKCRFRDAEEVLRHLGYSESKSNLLFEPVAESQKTWILRKIPPRR